MKYRTRIYYSEEQKTHMWDRWRKGESLHSIAKLFDNGSGIPCFVQMLSKVEVLPPRGSLYPVYRSRATQIYKDVTPHVRLTSSLDATFS